MLRTTTASPIPVTAKTFILTPSEKEVPADDPQEGRKPSERDSNERTENRSEGRDTLELIAPEDVPTHGKVLHAVHVHVRRRRLLRAGSPHVPVDPLSIAPVRDSIQPDRDDDPQKRS